MQHLYSNLRVSKNYALGTKLSVPRVKKRIEKPRKKCVTIRKWKPSTYETKKLELVCFPISFVVNASGVFFFFFLNLIRRSRCDPGTIVKRYVNILIIIIYSCICDLIVNREVRSLCEWRDQLEKYFDFPRTRSQS